MKSYEIGLGTGFMNAISKLQAAKAKNRLKRKPSCTGKKTVNKIARLSAVSHKTNHTTGRAKYLRQVRNSTTQIKQTNNLI